MLELFPHWNWLWGVVLFKYIYRCQPIALVIFPQYRIYDNSLNLGAELDGK